MPGVIAASSGSAWSYGGAILTFVFPMILFLAVAIALYVIYTKPSVVPGHREQAVARPIGYTPVVRLPGRDETPAGLESAAGPHYAFRVGDEQAAGQDAGTADAAGTGTPDPAGPGAGE